MKIKTLILTLIAVFTLCANVFASPAENIDNSKIQIEYFWGDGCSHCEAIKPTLELLEGKYKEDVVFNKHEIWNDKEEALKFNQYMELFKVPEDSRGTPSIIINNKPLIGDKEIIATLENEIIIAIDRKERLKKSHLDDEELNKLLSPIDIGENSESTMESDSMRLKAIAMTAIVDSINPCAIMVLIILLSTLIVLQKGKNHIILTSATFIMAVYMTYFLIGLGLTNLITSANISNTVTFFVGIIAILVGLANLKDAFFYRKGNWAIEIPEAWRNKLTKIIMSATSPLGAFVSGTMVTFIELPCTGGPYLFGLSLISHSATLMERILLLGFYNFIFILPLIIIAILVIQGAMTIERAEKLKNKNVKAMHFITGVVMLVLGIWAIAPRLAILLNI